MPNRLRIARGSALSNLRALCLMPAGWFVDAPPPFGGLPAGGGPTSAAVAALPERDGATPERDNLAHAFWQQPAFEGCLRERAIEGAGTGSNAISDGTHAATGGAGERDALLASGDEMVAEIRAAAAEVRELGSGGGGGGGGGSSGGGSGPQAAEPRAQQKPTACRQGRVGAAAGSVPV